LLLLLGQATQAGLVRDLGVSDDEAIALLKRSVELLVTARDEFWAGLSEEEQEKRCRPLAAVSIGPYGAFLADGSEYKGGYAIGEAELAAWHKERLDVIGRGGDILAMETVPCLDEVRALLSLLRDHFPEVPAWLSVTIKDEAHLCSGESLEEMAKIIQEDGPPNLVAVGVNCSAPQHISGAMERLKLAGLPLLTYPNSGEVWENCTHSWKAASGTSDDKFAEMCEEWLHGGVQLLGGCCRTSPETIRRVRVAVGQRSGAGL